MIRKWQCDNKGCKAEPIEWSYEELAENGAPICECGDDMELLPDQDDDCIYVAPGWQWLNT